MNPGRQIALVAMTALTAMLTACATTTQLPVSGEARRDTGGAKHQQLSFQLASGVYRCELGQRIEILRDARDAHRIGLNWQGRRHTLQRYDSTSGLPRYEDRGNGLVWIDLPWKSVLMDANSGRPLANECKAPVG